MPIQLQPFQLDDIDRLMSWIHSPEELYEWSGMIFRHPLNRKQLVEYQNSASDPFSRRQIFKALDSESADVVGHIEFSHIWPYLSGRVSRVIIGNSENRNHGLGSEMVKSLASAAFAEHSFHRIDVGVSTTNACAIACYEKAGFGHVGTWPRAMDTPEGQISVYWMSLFRGN